MSMATTRKTTKTAAGSTRRKTARTGQGTAASAPVGAAAAEPVVPAATGPRLHTVPPGAGPDAAEPSGDTDPRFKRPDLIQAVSERTALKRSDAKVVLELVLEELGKALDANEELVLPPLGKLMVKKRKPDEDGPDILTVKIRRPRETAPATGESPLADPGEDG
jgi:DNA-binding protein HU-alpha